jgi:hypothetical protein
MTGEWFFPPIPLILFGVLWLLTFALFMFRAGNEERSPKERSTKDGRSLPCRRTELASAKKSMARNTQALADSLGRNRVLEEDLSQL